MSKFPNALIPFNANRNDTYRYVGRAYEKII